MFSSFSATKINNKQVTRNLHIIKIKKPLNNSWVKEEIITEKTF